MPSQYKYFFNEENSTYQFKTKNNFTYTIVFVVDPTFQAISNKKELLDKVFQLVIEKNEDKNEPLDATVGLTIKQIITDFFRQNQNVIIYACDNEDGKGYKRFNVFERWYQSSQLKEYITKVDNVFDFEDVKFYTSVLYHNDNPHKDIVIESFNMVEPSLNQGK